MIPRSTDGKQRVLSLSYGKDSMACLGALEALGLPLDRIVTADVWATDTIPADLPQMVEFKDKADRWILEQYGIEVEHYHAVLDGRKDTFERIFYSRKDTGKYPGAMYGWPLIKGCIAQRRLKTDAINAAKRAVGDSLQYIGIAADEPDRLRDKPGLLYPLAEIGWTEADCRAWCEERGVLSPLYASHKRGGCFFCPCQSVGELRKVRAMHLDLWALMMRWDNDLLSDERTKPFPRNRNFDASGHTLHDFEARFRLEDEGMILPGEWFRWSMLTEELNYRLF